MGCEGSAWIEASGERWRVSSSTVDVAIPRRQRPLVGVYAARRRMAGNLWHRCRDEYRLQQHFAVVVVGEKLQAVKRFGDCAGAAELPDLGNRLVNQRRADRATLHRKQIVRIVTEIAQRELGLLAHVHTGAIAIAPGLGRMEFDVMLEFELGGATQSLAQNLRFMAKLRRVVDVLVMATAAMAEVGASWINPLRGRSDHVL